MATFLMNGAQNSTQIQTNVLILRFKQQQTGNKCLKSISKTDLSLDQDTLLCFFRSSLFCSSLK
jgi:hypothetical protein